VPKNVSGGSFTPKHFFANFRTPNLRNDIPLFLAGNIKACARFWTLVAKSSCNMLNYFKLLRAKCMPLCIGLDCVEFFIGSKVDISLCGIFL
jgi:hypothetical protein